MSNASLRSARLYSLAILVLGYVGLSFVWGHQQRLTTLTEARVAVARVLVALAGNESFPALGEIEQRDGDVRVRRPGGGEWSVAGVATIKDAAARESSLSRNLARLRDVSARIGIFDSGDNDLSDLYLQIEQRTLGTEVMVPGVGLGFQGMQVVWVSVIATFGFLVILRDRVQHVLSDEGLAVSERWLVIDGQVGIELVLSRLWLLALVLVPMALSSGLIVGVTTQIAADGATSSLFKDTVMAAGVLTLLTGNGWLALTAASQILELRVKRLELKGSASAR